MTVKLNTTPRVNDRDVLRELKEHAQTVNMLAEGRIAGNYNAQSAAPTTGKHAQGDVVVNLEPTELGSASSKYVIRGWQCVSGGEPGTWVEMRYLTGN
jgi:hypothetical protein